MMGMMEVRVKVTFMTSLAAAITFIFSITVNDAILYESLSPMIRSILTGWRDTHFSAKFHPLDPCATLDSSQPKMVLRDLCLEMKLACNADIFHFQM